MVIAALGAVLAAVQLPVLPSIPVSTGVVPDTVTVGEPFRSAVRLRLPEGARVSFPEFAPSDTLESADSVRVLRDSAGVVTVVYRLVGWMSGEAPAASVPIEVSLADGRRAVYPMRLRLPFVRSVLPPDSVPVRPRPPKPFLPLARSGVRAWWIGLLLGLIGAVGVAAWLYRGRRAPTVHPPRDPRELALARLDRLAAEGLPPGADLDEFYTRITRILRNFLATAVPGLGEDLTSIELLEAVASVEDRSLEGAALGSILAEAEPVKFAGSQPAEERAREFWQAARAWVVSFDTERTG